MKKFIIYLIIAVFSFFTITPCYAINKLYYLKNTNKTVVSTAIESGMKDKKYTIGKKDPYYAVSDKDPSNYAVVILRKDGENLYYYFESNNSSKKLNNAILKNIKSSGIQYQENEDPIQSNTFSSSVKKVLSGETKKYNFEEVKPIEETQKINKTEPSDNTLRGYSGKTGKGDVLSVYLQYPINTATAGIGDNVTCVLKEDWKTKENYLIAAKGSILNGKITDGHSAKVGLRNGYVRITFETLTTPDGKIYDISARNTDFHVSNDGIVQSVVTKVAWGAIVGGALGAALSLIGGYNSEDFFKSMAVGAGIGGGSQLIYSGIEQGIDAEIPAYTDINVEITKDIHVVISF